MTQEPTLFLEISTLQELSYTGIPKVALELARHFLTRNDVEFFWDDYIIPKDFVRSLVASETGASLCALAARSIDFETVLSRLRRSQKSIAVFPNTMTRKYFDKHVQIIHDLVFLVAPEYHHIDTIAYHATTIQRDVDTADALVCVSASTAQDVMTYLGVPREKVNIVLNGVRAPANPAGEGKLEKFILTIGTIEPRKNIEIILKYISSNKKSIRDYTFVFCGRDGWLVSFDDMIEDYDLNEFVNDGKIIRLPFISEDLKWKLLGRASLLIFPSFYEGFGLPVLEALSVGTPVLASWSSSMPEVGGDLVSYFDPSDYRDFETSLTGLLDKKCAMPEDWASQAKTLATTCSWQRFSDDIAGICLNLYR